eukprot:5660353-Pleurochrysis_carterae.AAC.1
MIGHAVACADSLILCSKASFVRANCTESIDAGERASHHASEECKTLHDKARKAAATQAQSNLRRPCSSRRDDRGSKSNELAPAEGCARRHLSPLNTAGVPLFGNSGKFACELRRQIEATELVDKPSARRLLSRPHAALRHARATRSRTHGRTTLRGFVSGREMERTTSPEGG